MKTNATTPWLDDHIVTRRDLWILAAITAVGFAIRSYGIMDRGFWHDEIDLWSCALTGRTSPQAPGFPAWLHGVVMRALGRADSFTLRLPALVFGTLAIPAIAWLAYVVSRHRAVMFLAAALAALSPVCIYFSQEARPYGLLLLLSALALGFYLRARQTRRIGFYLLATGLFILALNTHFLAINLLIGLTLYEIVTGVLQKTHGAPWKRVFSEKTPAIACVAVAIAVGLIWFWFRHQEVLSFGPSVYRKSAAVFVRISVLNLGAGRGTPPPFLWAEIGGLIWLAAAISTIFRDRRTETSLFLPLVIIPSFPILALTLSQASNFPWGRFLIPIVPPYLALVASSLRPISSRTGQTWVATLLILAMAPGVIKWAQQDTFFRSETLLRQAQMVAGIQNQLDGVILYHSQPFFPLRRAVNIYLAFSGDTLPIWGGRPPILNRIEVTQPIKKVRLADRIYQKRKPVPPGRYALVATGAPMACSDLLLFRGITTSEPDRQLPNSICLVNQTETPPAEQ